VSLIGYGCEKIDTCLFHSDFVIQKLRSSCFVNCTYPCLSTWA